MFELVSIHVLKTREGIEYGLLSDPLQLTCPIRKARGHTMKYCPMKRIYTEQDVDVADINC